MTNYDGGKTISVNAAIDLLSPIVTAPGGIFTQNEKLALSMAISALEKEKEQALQEAKTSSNNNNSISNDNTKLKECQEVINVAARILTRYFGYLPEREQELWKMGGAHALLKRADKLFEEEKQ